MCFKKYYLSLLPLIAGIAFLLTQSLAKCEDKMEKDTSFWDDFRIEDSWDKVIKIEQPLMELQYGLAGKPSIHKDAFDGKFAGINSFELRLGFSEKKNPFKNNALIEYNFTHFYLSNLTSDWKSKADIKEGEIRTNSWRFGFADVGGWGYNLGSSTDLIFYNTNFFGWTKIDFKDTAQNPGQQGKIDVYGDDFRFGEGFEAGIKAQIFSPLSINVAYERSIVYPRHLFWYWTTSKILEGIGDGILTYFIREVRNASPVAGPIVYFVLKNAYDYGIFELRKKYMNWPLKSSSPIMFEGYKVGLSFAF